MSFVAIAPPPASPEADILQHGFWPSLSPAECRSAMRIDDTVTGPRLHHALVEAVFSINRRLESWRDLQLATGASTLAGLPAEQVGGRHRLVHLYQRAVYCYCKASLLERYRDIDTEPTARDRIRELTPEIDDYRREVAWAIADLTGTRRAVVELL